MINKKKIYIRADANKEVGFGHFIRSLALAEILIDDFECIFFTVEPTNFQKEQILKVCKLIELSKNNFLEEFLSFLNGDEIVFLDNYFFTPNYQLQIKKMGCKLICIGLNDRHYYSDIVINYVETDIKSFSAEPYTKILLGLEWVILRKEFQRRYNHVIPIKKVVICFGGTDQFYLTEKSISILKKSPNIKEINVISTDVIGLDRINKMKDEGIICHLNCSAQNILEIFKNVDCAITSASTITHEALSSGLPVICGYYVENQYKMYYSFLERNLVVGVGNLLELNENLLKAINDVNDLKYSECNFYTDNLNRLKQLFLDLC